MVNENLPKNGQEICKNEQRMVGNLKIARNR